MRLILVRHGETFANVRDVCDDDPGVKTRLTKKGEAQARRVARILKDRDFDMIYVSELFRTDETADIINKFHNARMKVDKRLDDRKSGFAGKSEKAFVKFLEGSDDYWNAKHPPGESFEEEKKRVLSFLKSLKGKKYRSVLVVSHEQPIQIVRGWFGGESNDEIVGKKVRNCQVLEFDL